jgi:hypothetical protein
MEGLGTARLTSPPLVGLGTTSIDNVIGRATDGEMELPRSTFGYAEEGVDADGSVAVAGSEDATSPRTSRASISSVD